MNIETAFKSLEKYENDEIIRNYIAQANSRYIYYTTNEPSENFPDYKKGLDERCLHIAFAYLDFGWCFFTENQKNEATFCMEKAARLLEHLYSYKKCSKIYREYFNLTCALGYYVASQYSKSFIILKYYTCDTQLAKIIKYFLLHKFAMLDKELKDVYFKDKSTIGDNEIESFIYTKILGDAIFQMLQYIFNGNDEALKNAKKILLDLINLSKINDEAHLWWVFRLLYLVFEEHEEASLWTVLPTIIGNEQLCKNYIHANLYKEKPIVELFKSQRECIQKKLDSNDGFVVSMPTSSGKTKVAEIAIVKTLSENPDALCVYIAPFRTLANEIEHNLSSVLNTMGYMVSHLYGSVQATQIDRQLITKADVVIATPEKIKSILRSNIGLEERIKLIIVDEGHLVGDNKRYITAELLIEELKIVLNKNVGKFILLSAVLPNLSDFSEWISGSKERISKSSWQPSTQRFGELRFVNNRVHLHWEGEHPSYNNNFIERKEILSKRKNSKTVYFPKDKKEAVGATAVKMLTMGSVLIFVGRINMVESQASVISKLFFEKNIIHEWKNITNLSYVELACEEAYGKNSAIYSFIQQGIVCHYSKLPTDVRQSIERLMSSDSPKIIIATSTLAQGVNIGVSTTIISNVSIGYGINIDVKDFWNIAGRAGRAFIDTEGKILYAIDRHQSNYSIQNQIVGKQKYFQQSNIEKAKSGIFILLKKLFQISQECDIDYELFLELLAENRAVVDNDKVEYFFRKSNYWLDLLDDTLISMDVKNDAQDLQDYSEWIDDIFRSSLAYIQAKNSEGLIQENVIDILKARNTGVIKLAGSVSAWTSLACSSVSLRMSLFIESHIEELSEVVNIYAQSFQSFDDLMTLISYFDEFITKLPVSDSKIEELIKSVNTIPIREEWFSGMFLYEMDKEATIICKDYYGFHFPWIINAISAKLHLTEKLDEAKILEDVSLFSEIGVPNIESVKIYLTGIKSRECAIELSDKIKIDDNQIDSVKRQLLNILKLSQNEQIECSDKAIRWLTLFGESNKHTSFSLENIATVISDDQTDVYTELYIKSYDNEFYFCSYDYKIKLLIHEEEKNKFKHLIDIEGVFFEKKLKNVWRLKSHNPYVRIVQD